MLTQAELAQAVELLDRRVGLAALYLFGSEAEGRARVDSDVDLAAVSVRRVDGAALLDARAELAAVLGRDVDLVDLERASPVLAMQVLEHGRLVADRVPSLRARFAMLLPSRYEDLRIVRRPIEKKLVERVHG